MVELVLSGPDKTEDGQELPLDEISRKGTFGEGIDGKCRCRLLNGAVYKDRELVVDL